MTTHLTIVPDLETHLDRLWGTPLVRLALAHPDVFAKVVRRQRLALEFSQREVGKRCGYSYTAIRSIEERTRHPRPFLINAVADTLALKADDLRAYIAEMADRELEEAA